MQSWMRLPAFFVAVFMKTSTIPEPAAFTPKTPRRKSAKALPRRRASQRGAEKLFVAEGALKKPLGAEVFGRKSPDRTKPWTQCFRSQV
jgi:hypothetical protein